MLKETNAQLFSYVTFIVIPQIHVLHERAIYMLQCVYSHSEV